MPGVVIQFIDKKSKAISYWPKGFGFTSHEFSQYMDGAEIFTSEADAQKRLTIYEFPNAFWECERQHRQAMEQKRKTWTTQIMPVDGEPTMPEIRR